mgnify:CR=1 FL=1
MSMDKKLEIYCVTNKRIKYLENFEYKLAAVGKENFPDNYMKSNLNQNIFYKEQYYSELTFHYWFWKNKLKKDDDKWIGFCQRRRFWINKESENRKINNKNFNEIFLTKAQKEWENYDSIICKPISINNVKKMKMIKKGFSNILKNPSIFFDTNKQNIKLHFDLHHGNGNLDKAISLLDKNDKDDFYEYVVSKTHYNPHIMFISKPEILEKWFSTLFPWLKRCEKIFGFQNLKGYETTRIYAYLAERYLSFWFKKYSSALEWPWSVYENYEK